MVRIIPALLAKDKEDFLRRAKLVADSVDLAQVDVLDGVFLPEKSWAEPVEIAQLGLPLFFEAHLMVQNPEEKIKSWSAVAERIIFHFEATAKPEVCIEEIRRYNKKVGLAINPETSVETIAPYLRKIDFLLVMGVNPGKMGQQFLPETITKIKQVRKIMPELPIMVDGGVKKENIATMYEAGVRDFVVGSGIFKAADPKNELKEYLKIVEQCDKRSTLQ